MERLDDRARRLVFSGGLCKSGDIRAGMSPSRTSETLVRDGKDAMESSTFDRLVRRITANGSRRGLLRSVLAAATAGLGSVSVLSSDDAAAKSCKAKCNKRKNRNKRAKCKKNCDANNVRCKTENVPCAVDEECCSTQNLVCDALPGSEQKTCCRGQGAPCGSAPDSPPCCAGTAGGREFQCFGGVCQDCSIGLCK
jgi:hypothetical protein